MSKLQVFVSHISEEAPLAALLQDRIRHDFLGLVEIFVSSDTASIIAGDNWLVSINEALRRAQLLLVLCSRASVQRPWINFEAGAAWITDTKILPICHSGLRPHQLPMPLSVLHAVEAHDPSGLERVYLRITERLRELKIDCSSPRIDFAEFAERVEEFENHYQPPPLPEPDQPAYSRIEHAINQAELGWTLCFIGEDQSDKLAVLTQDLRRPFSESGDGKQFASGFSYWGIGPTLAWARACSDPLYLVMKKSIESFHDRWANVLPSFSVAYHYVSLGIGTGSKDRRILRDLSRLNRDLYYFPVDMSPEMLRVGIKESIGSQEILRCKLLPIQIDFSLPSNAVELYRMLHRMIGDEPIVFSLLGNTLANFEDDTELLMTLRPLLRPQDRLLLEVASTARLDDLSTRAAADEYSRSTAFRQFVTSALLQYTDLPAGIETVTFASSQEDSRAILIKAIYQNRSDHVVPMKLPDNTTISFKPRDTIRLLITRKYTADGIDRCVADAGLRCVNRTSSLPSREGFALDLLVLAATDPAPTSN
jgi:uncharacterized SAM-dependent methyltransferase